MNYAVKNLDAVQELSYSLDCLLSMSWAEVRPYLHIVT